MKLTRQRIEWVARQARQDFEAGSDHLDRSQLQQLYKAYNPLIPDIQSFVEAAIKSFPHGACGLTAVYMNYLLGDKGEVIYGSYLAPDGNWHGHTVLWFPELQLISCVSSDQFQGPPIYVGLVGSPWSLSPQSGLDEGYGGNAVCAAVA